MVGGVGVIVDEDDGPGLLCELRGFVRAVIRNDIDVEKLFGIILVRIDGGDGVVDDVLFVMGGDEIGNPRFLLRMGIGYFLMDQGSDDLNDLQKKGQAEKDQRDIRDDTEDAIEDFIPHGLLPFRKLGLACEENLTISCLKAKQRGDSCVETLQNPDILPIAEILARFCRVFDKNQHSAVFDSERLGKMSVPSLQWLIPR